MWQPYFTGAGWDPYMNGAWTQFPGQGYGWVSSYPWGWTPYNYGAWNYVPLYGWMWQPGGAWMGGYPIPVYLNTPLGFDPPRIPMFPGPRVLSVNRGSGSIISKHSQIEIPGNSAGLGVPRGSIQNLYKMSSLAEQRGSATTQLRLNPIGLSSWWGGSNAGASRGMNWGARGNSITGLSAPSMAGSGHVGGGGAHK
jgi:hypothetical protein